MTGRSVRYREDGGRQTVSPFREIRSKKLRVLKDAELFARENTEKGSDPARG